MSTEVNVTGKYVIPMPEFVIALATQTLTIKGQDLRKSYFSESIVNLMSEIIKDSKAVYKDDGSVDWDKTRTWDHYFSYVVLEPNGFYNIVDFSDAYAEFKVGRTQVREFSYNLYTNDGSKSYFGVGNVRRVTSGRNMCILIPDDREIEKMDPAVKSVYYNMRSSNIKTTNQFLGQHGMHIENKYTQSYMDSKLQSLSDYINLV